MGDIPKNLMIVDDRHLQQMVLLKNVDDHRRFFLNGDLFRKKIKTPITANPYDINDLWSTIVENAYSTIVDQRSLMKRRRFVDDWKKVATLFCYLSMQNK